MKKLSIIVPIYNVEKYVRECVESIFRQGLSENEFEVILVNDGTPDNSIGVISEIIEGHKNVILINQDNQGVSKARNAGLRESQGQYVYFMDPDDLLVDNALSVLLPKVLSLKIDIMMAGYCKFNDGEDYDQLVHVHQNYTESLKPAEKAFLEDLSPYECYIWLLLIRRDFLIDNKIDFKPFWYEDTLFCQECFLSAKTVLKTDFRLYAYRMRPGSFTSSMNVNKLLDLNSCLSALVKIKDAENLSRAVRNKLCDNIFSSFSYGIWCITHSEALFSQRKMIVSDLKAKIPPSSFMFNRNVKQIMVSFMFRYFPYLYLRIRRL